MCIVRKNWPAVGVLLGLSTAVTGTVLAATGHEAALIAVGSSNLSSVLALSGASLLVFSCLMWYRSMAKERKKEYYFSIWKAAPLAVISAAAMIGIGYIGIHYGIGPALLDGWGAIDSLLAQAGIGLIIGAATGFGIFAFISSFTENHTLTESMEHAWIAGLIMTVGSGLLCSASTALGPAFALYIGMTTTNAAEVLAIDALIAVGIASLAFMSYVIGREAHEAMRYDHWDWKS